MLVKAFIKEEIVVFKATYTATNAKKNQKTGWTEHLFVPPVAVVGTPFCIHEVLLNVAVVRCGNDSIRGFKPGFGQDTICARLVDPDFMNSGFRLELHALRLGDAKHSIYDSAHPALRIPRSEHQVGMVH